jgi:putative hemolysin
MRTLRRGRLAARFAETPEDLRAALALRSLCFRAGAPDGDSFDPACRHVLVEEARTGRLVCTFRLLPLACGGEIGRSYSAQHYDLAALEGFAGPMVEMGRFCIHPEHGHPDVLRVAWGAMTAFVDAENVQMLFGCSSFAGTEAERHLDAFALLRDRHLAPPRWLPRVKGGDVFRFARGRAVPKAPDLQRAVKGLPPLLRTYLAMGGWVSDHAVVDRDLGTLHVFTGLEIAAIPPGRARRLRAIAS